MDAPWKLVESCLSKKARSMHVYRKLKSSDCRVYCTVYNYNDQCTYLKECYFVPDLCVPARKESRKFRPLDSATLGWCVTWMMRPLDNVFLNDVFLNDVPLGRSVPWTMRLFDDSRDRCVLTLWDRLTLCRFRYRLGRTAEANPGIHYTNITLSVAVSHPYRNEQLHCLSSICHRVGSPQNSI
jgi:hypothetical protein